MPSSKLNVESYKHFSFITDRITNARIYPSLFYPWRKCKVKLYGLLAEMLLQRTRAEQVINIYKNLCREYKNSEDIASSSIRKIKKIIYPLGLSWRAKKIKEMAKTLNKKYFGDVPEDYSSLISLPGVGDYVASSFLSLHCGKRAILLDSNIIRLLSRFYGFRTTPETRRNPQIKILVDKVTPLANIKKFNYSLLDISRQICSIRPSCLQCPLNEKCLYFNERGQDAQKNYKKR